MIKKVSPSLLIGLSFILIILISSILLYMPFTQYSGNEPVRYIDSLFIVTSALCVTGLVSVDPATVYNIYGKTIIIILIQLGGLGILTFSSMIILLISNKMTYFTKKVIQEDLNYNILSNIPEYIKQVAIIVFSIEILGALILFGEFSKKYSFLKAVFYSLFHAVSAFCNAGFSLYSDSLSGYKTNLVINLTIASLIILGGLGFSVILDFYYRIKGRRKYFLVTTKFSLYITAILLISGTVIIFLLEYTNKDTIANLSLKNKIIASFFESTTLRTAGFLTIDQVLFRPVTKIISLIFMFIGAGPGSTGGGIKTTTLGVIIFGVYYSVKNKDIMFSKRMIPIEIYKKATAIVFIAILYLIISYLFLVTIENGNNLLEILYELISAFGTVGLSLNFTPKLQDLSKIIIIITMFIGRIGPLTLAIALSKNNNTKEKYKYPVENILIG